VSSWDLVLAASIACLAFKLLGYAVPPRWLEGATASRMADLLTVALLAALVGTQTLGSGQHLVIDARLPALAVAAGLYWLKVPFIVVVIVAAVVAALLRDVAGMA